MKKSVLLFLLILTATSLFAQDKIAVYVYSTAPLNEPINALRANIEEALINSAGSSYTVIDRTEEFQAILDTTRGYQAKGYVSDNQLIATGKELQVNKVCGVVITDYGKEGYFIECKILDVKERKVDCKAKYPVGGVKITDLGIATSEKVALSLASQLKLFSDEQMEEVERKRQKEREAQEAEIKAREERDRKQREWDDQENKRRTRELRAEQNREEFRCFFVKPGGAMLSSAVVPGLGLINKGHTGWGATFLVAEAGLVAGTIVTYNNAQTLLPKLKDPNITVDEFTTVNTQYSTLQVMNNIFLGAAAAVYVTNLIATLASKNNSNHPCSVQGSFLNVADCTVPTVSVTFNL